MDRQLIGIAGVHHVVSELSRRGMIALPTVRNIAAYDIIVSSMSGRKHANLQVKASKSRVTNFPVAEGKLIRVHRNSWFVLLRWIKAEGCFEGFMLSSEEARAEARRAENGQRKAIRLGTRKVLRPCIYVGPKQKERDRWKKRWDSWKI